MARLRLGTRLSFTKTKYVPRGNIRCDCFITIIDVIWWLFVVQKYLGRNGRTDEWRAGWAGTDGQTETTSYRDAKWHFEIPKTQEWNTDFRTWIDMKVDCFSVYFLAPVSAAVMGNFCCHFLSFSVIFCHFLSFSVGFCHFVSLAIFPQLLINCQSLKKEKAFCVPFLRIKVMEGIYTENRTKRFGFSDVFIQKRGDKELLWKR